MALCAGVDWAKDTHDVWVADDSGQRLWAETVAHDEAGLKMLCKTLVTLGVDRVAVERPDGLLVQPAARRARAVLARRGRALLRSR